MCPRNADDGNQNEETLDPANWNELRALGHRMIDEMLDHLATLRERPAWQPVPAEVRMGLDQPLPLEPQDASSVYEEFVQKVLPYTNGNRHPRFWGWVQGNGTPLAMLADMLASGMNPHLAGFNQAPALVEHQVLRWLIELMGMPQETSGLLVSGGTMANFNALVVARHAQAGFDVRRLGLQGHDHPRLVFYGSAETHGWAQSAAELLGLGNEAFRRVPVDGQFRIDLGALAAQVAADRSAGYKPFCVIGNAGTVNTGATDDLSAASAFCKSEGLWFHVDGAFGALARLSPSLKSLVTGLESADSVAFDLHKWMYLPFEIACVLVRDPTIHREAFAMTANYFGEAARGVISDGLPFSDRGLELTRGFRALKVWMSLKAHGVRAFARLIEQNVRQAEHLARLVRSHSSLELLAPVPLNIVCFRFSPSGVSEERLNEVNQEILLRVQESGLAVPSSTLIDDKFALRVAITNHRSKREDFELFVKAVVETGVAILRGE